MEERWKPIPGFEGYEVSDRGRVRSYWTWKSLGIGYGTESYIACEPQRIRSTKARMSRTGYPALNIKGQMYPVHRLVLLAFVGPLPEGMETRHLDGNPENNHLSNLCYGTPSENSYDMYKHGYKGPRKLNAKQVRDMRRMAANGATKNELAELFEIAPKTVSNICLGHGYGDCPGPIAVKLARKPRKLTNKQVVEIRRKLKAGAKGADLAYQYDVHESTISRIKSGERRESVYAKKNQD